MRMSQQLVCSETLQTLAIRFSSSSHDIDHQSIAMQGKEPGCQGLANSSTWSSWTYIWQKVGLCATGQGAKACRFNCQTLSVH